MAPTQECWVRLLYVSTGSFAERKAEEEEKMPSGCTAFRRNSVEMEIESPQSAGVASALPQRSATGEVHLAMECDDSSRAASYRCDSSYSDEEANSKGLSGEEEVDETGANQTLEELISSRAAPMHRTSHDSLISPDRLVNRFDGLVCPVCRHVVDQAVSSPCCGHLNCAECIWLWLSHNTHCPTCPQSLVVSQPVQAPQLMSGLLAQVLVKCTYSSDGCKATVQLSTLKAHEAECLFGKVEGPQINPAVITPSSTAKEILTALPSKLQGNIGRKLTAHLVDAHGEGSQLTVFKGTKPQTWERISRCEVPSDDAAERTKRRRSEMIRAVRETICGAGRGAEAQMSLELNSLPRETQKKLLKDAGLKPNGTLESGTALALKADLGLPWYRLRKLRLWLKSFGVNLESEGVMRQQLAEELPFPIVAKYVPMAEKNGAVTMKVMVVIEDLVGIVCHYLSQHEEAGTLYWHNALPEQEIWIKLGGDHGGGSFKLSFQIANVQQPNSTKNTVPFILFSAKDYISNLTTALKPFQDKILQLRNTSWKDKKIRVILFGDYEFMCACYGLSGASGKYPCLFCEISKKEMQTAPSERQTLPQLRTLDTLAKSYHEFQEAGSPLPRAKAYLNVIRPVLLPIPLEDVCLPALHLDLGIFPYLFDAMLADIRQIDAELALTISSADLLPSDSAQFTQAVAQQEKLTNKKKEAEEVQANADTVRNQVCLITQRTLLC